MEEQRKRKEEELKWQFEIRGKKLDRKLEVIKEELGRYNNRRDHEAADLMYKEGNRIIDLYEDLEEEKKKKI